MRRELGEQRTLKTLRELVAKERHGALPRGVTAVVRLLPDERLAPAAVFASPPQKAKHASVLNQDGEVVNVIAHAAYMFEVHKHHLFKTFIEHDIPGIAVPVAQTKGRGPQLGAALLEHVQIMAERGVTEAVIRQTA